METGGGGGEVLGGGGGGALAPVEAGGASPIPTLRKLPRAAVASDGRRLSCQSYLSLFAVDHHVNEKKSGNFLADKPSSQYDIMLPFATADSGLPCATVAKDLLAEGRSAVDKKKRKKWVRCWQKHKKGKKWVRCLQKSKKKEWFHC